MLDYVKPEVLALRPIHEHRDKPLHWVRLDQRTQLGPQPGLYYTDQIYAPRVWRWINADSAWYVPGDGWMSAEMVYAKGYRYVCPAVLPLVEELRLLTRYTEADGSEWVRADELDDLMIRHVST